VALTWPAAGHARIAADPAAAALAAALREPGVAPGRTGALVLDASDGSVVFGRNARKPLAPASTEKLTVALAALQELGPGFRIQTLVLGRGVQDGTVWRGDLLLVGQGDPSLHADDLGRLAGQIRSLGIRAVAGRVLGDESFFDSRRTAPGWKASYYKNESAPLSALIVDRAWLDGRQRDEPPLAAAIAFDRALEAAGVRVSGKPGRGAASEEAVELARVASPTIARLVDYMNTDSDNFVAEMLVKQLGARELGRGTTAAGASIVRGVLAERGVPLAGVRIADGSGLSRLDRLTARALAALLLSAWNDPAIAGPFVASLPVAGVNGTLEDRMRTGPARGVVKAKTGTTDVSSSLAGYAGSGYVFAVLMNGSPIPSEPARAAQDRFAQLLAGSLKARATATGPSPRPGLRRRPRRGAPRRGAAPSRASSREPRRRRAPSSSSTPSRSPSHPAPPALLSPARETTVRACR
jgi:D-alanyl-D-alanine carboxypeptidase/D-alanyl-D-alanine-endopeptidase (penicillin-binding protein 4)